MREMKSRHQKFVGRNDLGCWTKIKVLSIDRKGCLSKIVDYYCTPFDDDDDNLHYLCYHLSVRLVLLHTRKAYHNRGEVKTKYGDVDDGKQSRSSAMMSIGLASD